MIDIFDGQARLTNIPSKDIKNQSREKWLAERSGYIGGSDVYPLVAEYFGYEYKWSTPFTVICKKLGIYKEKTTPAMLNGISREPIIRQKAAQEIRQKLGLFVEVFESPYLYSDPIYPWMRANIDGLCVDNGQVFGLEIKTTRSWKDWDDIPIYYEEQLRHYFHVTGLADWILIAENGDEYRVFLKQFNEDDAEKKKKYVDFLVNSWTDIKNHNIPDPVGIPKIEKNCLETMLKEQALVSNVGNDVLVGVARQYLEVLQQEKEIKEKKEKLNFVLKQAAGLTSEIQVDDVKLVFETRTRESFDSKAFRLEHKDLYKKFLKTTEYFQLGVKK